MVDDIIGVFTLALIVGVLAVAIRNGSNTSTIINSTLNGFANVEKASLGN